MLEGSPTRQAILFDYDDTLVQTRQCKYQALQALAKRHYAIELSTEQLNEHWGVAYADLFRRLFGAVENDLSLAIQRYEALDAEFPMRLYPDTLPTLDALQQTHHVGIVTAAGRNIVERQLATLGVRVDRLVLLQTAEDTAQHKPDPQVFEPALAKLHQLGVPRESITYVGDSVQDYFAARDAGLQFWGVLRGTTPREAFASAGARTAESLADLLRRI